MVGGGPGAAGAAGAGAPGAGLARPRSWRPTVSGGVGAALVRAGLDSCATAGFGWIVVLGDPAYYARFGFRPAAEAGLRDEYGGGPAFQVLELRAGALPAGAGLARYAPEFASLG